MKGDPLNLPHPPAPPPKPAEKSGGVRLKWSKEVAKSNLEEDISPEESWLRDLRELNMEEPVIEERMLEDLKQVNQHFKTRNELLRLGNKEDTAMLREFLMKPGSEGGTFMRCLLLEPEMRKVVQLSPVDLAARIRVEWGTDWESYLKARMPDEMGMSEVQEVIALASMLLERNTPEMLRSMGEEVVQELLERHQLFSDGLVGVDEVSEGMEALLPESKVDAIMEWYIRLVAGLQEMDQQRLKRDVDAQALASHLQSYPGPRLAQREERSRSRGGVTVAYAGGSRDRGEDLLEQRMSDSRLVQQARQLGAEWRTGGGTPRQEEMPRGNQFNPERGITDLPASLIRSKAVRPESLGNRSVMRTPSISSYSNSEAPTGFDGDDLPTIKAELRVYVEEQLSKLGKGNPETIGILMDNFPLLGFKSKGRGHEIRDFLKVSKLMVLKMEDDYISVAEWWKKLNKHTNDFCWSLSIRVRFLSRFGGLPEKGQQYQAIRERVMTLMEEISKWMPDFDESKSESSGHYWLYVWIRVGLKLIEEFHQNQTTTKVEDGVKEFMRSDRFEIERVDNPLNSQFHKVEMLYKATNSWLRDRSSGLVDSPLYVWKLVGEWLKSQLPVGPYMLQHIDKALNKLGSDPRNVFPEGHQKSAEEIQEIKRKGAAGATEEVYGLILQQLKHRAANDELAIELKSLTAMGGGIADGGGGWSKVGAKPEKKKQASKTLSVSTDFSSLTMNTHFVKGDGGSRYTLCKTCSLFHKDGTCLFWDKTKKKFNHQAFFNHRSVREIKADGSSQLSDYWTKKLKQFAFPKMNITAKDTQDRIINDLKALASKQPKASKEEIERFAESQAKYVNLAEMEEKSHLNLLKGARDSIVNAVATLASKKSKKKSKRAAKRRQAAAEDSSNSDSSSESDEDSDGSYDSARS
jgi:hypothetical protein